MTQAERETIAADFMTRFAERTGLSSSDRPPRRYLWTDAFAVCNFLGLAGASVRTPFRELAIRLVDQVHHVLGHHRADDPRSGWISGLGEGEGEAHPTRGGLRIGKKLPERDPNDPPDQEFEWDRDGQYYHYLTRWMHALDQLTHWTGEPAGNRWARELAERAHAAFAYAPSPHAPRRMVWKMSIDLTRPLVPSMGQHDPLDGLVTYLQLRAHRGSAGDPDLDAEIGDMARIASGRDWRTDDPLGLGGLLDDAYRLEQLARDSVDAGRLLPAVLEAAVSGLGAYLRQRPLDRSIRHRLAFRELGLSIGLHAVDRMWIALRRNPEPFDDRPAVRVSLERLVDHLPLIETIESFWLEPAHQRAESWLAHHDINAVMLATSLAPAGYLVIG